MVGLRMPQNISDLNDEETDWILRFMEACAANKTFKEPSPSQKAADRINHNMKEAGM